ncbi:hypothetical protein SLA2020_037390 [Shorea laevis]
MRSGDWTAFRQPAAANPATLLSSDSMKRKKWSELEEQKLLSKCSDLLKQDSGEKAPAIADHVNSVHHLQDPVTFPFKWSWRDFSIKVHEAPVPGCETED